MKPSAFAGALAPLLGLALFVAGQEPQSGAACADCHGELTERSAGQIHMRIRPFEVRDHKTGCEGCHGDGARHMASGDPADIRRFDQSASSDAACLECHAARGQADWHASTHANRDVSCGDCHKIHTSSAPLAACRNCHADVAARFQLPSHHPVREGKMTCTSCHDTHSANEAQLRTAERVNELCYTCHLDKEGPYVFEHQPVQEDCRLCHEPHGATADKLLTANEPMLCLQCHEFHFHAGYRAGATDEVDVGGIPRENPFGTRSFNIAMTTKCSQCHAAVHGSDLPAQSVPGRGQGLVR
jgi:DmsE family decaheme c-type cytochrome